MGQRFLDNAREGNNSGGRYWLVISGVAIYWLFFAYGTHLWAQTFLEKLRMGQLASEIISGALPFAVIIGWLAIALPRFHNRPFLSLINAESGINYRRLAQGLLAGFAFLGFFSFIDLWIYAEDYTWTFAPGQWFVLLVTSVLMVPIQTSAEEIFYRGYLLQGLGLKTRNPLILMVVVSFAFAIPHFANPEMARGAFVWGALYYFVVGVVYAAITLKDNGLELALGLHAATNLFGYLIMSTPDSVAPTPALWIYEPWIDPRISFCSALIEGVFIYLVFFGGLSRPSDNESVKEKDSSY